MHRNRDINLFKRILFAVGIHAKGNGRAGCQCGSKQFIGRKPLIGSPTDAGSSARMVFVSLVKQSYNDPGEWLQLPFAWVLNLILMNIQAGFRETSLNITPQTVISLLYWGRFSPDIFPTIIK